jgi:hypothetical protein
MNPNVSCVENDPVRFIPNTPCEEQTATAHLRFHLFLALYTQGKGHSSSLKSPPLHQEVGKG